MQDVASEMNTSETAFARRLPDGAKFNLRWFTPKAEVDLCGHATLATAHILWEDGHLSRDEPGLFETRSGLLTALRGPDGIELDFPTNPVSEPHSPDPALIGRAADRSQGLHSCTDLPGRSRLRPFLVEPRKRGSRPLPAPRYRQAQ